jgi:hypothetical protein
MADFVYIHVTRREEGANEQMRRQAVSAGADRVLQVNDLYEFQAVFAEMKDTGVRIRKLVIWSHGQAGSLYLMGDILDSARLSRFAGKGFENLFEPDARVQLYGCQVAKEEVGRDFLRVFARTFLFKGGGRVSGFDAYTVSSPLFSSGAVALFGDNVHAIIGKGGKKIRMAAGAERPDPVGQWKVTLPGGDVEFYWFYRDGTVKWNDGKLVFGESGKGTWSIVGDQLVAVWESGSRESWDTPLFEKEQTGIWYRKDATQSEIRADKIIDSDRIFD